MLVCRLIYIYLYAYIDMHICILFLIYVNDFQNCLKFSFNVSFTDDTNVFLSSRNIQSLYDKENKELSNIDDWMLANKLTVNVKNTKCILFKACNPCKSRKTTQTSELKLRSEVIARVSSIRFLGVTIHENLIWKHHMYAVKKKMRAALGAVMRIWSFLNKKAMLTLYHSLILSHVRYCAVNWCCGNVTIVGQLQRIRNKFIRIIFGLNRRSSVKDVMIENGLLTIKQIRDLEICIFMLFKSMPSCPITKSVQHKSDSRYNKKQE